VSFDVIVSIAHLCLSMRLTVKEPYLPTGRFTDRFFKFWLKTWNRSRRWNCSRSDELPVATQLLRP